MLRKSHYIIIFVIIIFVIFIFIYADFDGDALENIYEIAVSHTNPINFDTDRDWLSDREELCLHGTNPLNPDSDADGLSDGREIFIGINPLKYDTDGDGLPDGEEVKLGTDPLKAGSVDILRVEVIGGNILRLTIRNMGYTDVRLKRIIIEGPNIRGEALLGEIIPYPGRTTIDVSLSRGYILPGSTVDLTITIIHDKGMNIQRYTLKYS